MPESGLPDEVLGFQPGDGIHNIHMNQGNGGQFAGDNGVWQDGALLIHFPAQSQWDGFSSPSGRGARTPTTGPGTSSRSPGSAADHRVRIVAALVDPVGPAPGSETVALLNSSPDGVDLTGWSVVDRLERRIAVLPSLGQAPPSSWGCSHGRPRQQGWTDHAARRRAG